MSEHGESGDENVFDKVDLVESRAQNCAILEAAN
jgi:hypothetical protein